MLIPRFSSPARTLLLLAAMLAISASLWGERLPLKSFTSADGLAHDHINRIYRDSHGFLWICTDEGFSRFDGYDFTNFTVADGLPHMHANDILEIPDKGYWVATDAGLAWFDTKRFSVYHPPGGPVSSQINTLAQDPHGILWLGTNDGLFRMKDGVIELVDPGKQVHSVRFDGSGSMWVATTDGAYHRDKDGAVSRFLDNYINATFHDSSGRHWILTRIAGFTILGRGSFSVKNGLPHNDVRSVYEAAPGRYWLATLGGLVEMLESPNGVQFRVYTSANGLSDDRIYKLETDSDGNLWIGTNHAGIQRLAREGFVSYDDKDGLRPSPYHAFSETRNGTVILVSGDDARRTLHWFDGRRFHGVPLMLPPEAGGFAWGWNQHAFEDREERWWLPSQHGLYRYPRVRDLDALAALQPKFIQTPQDGCPITRLYEDSQGDVWMATSAFPGCVHPDQLVVWRRRTGALERFETRDPNWPKEWVCTPKSIQEDNDKTLWAGLACGGVLRLRGGHVERFAQAEGVPASAINALIFDRHGRLWAGSSEGGLARVDEPAAAKPRFVTYTAASGLSSNQIWTLVEDTFGRIYAATGRGLDRIDPSRPIGPDTVTRFTPSDGFLKGEIRASHRDRNGNLWFASVQGVARLTPVPPERPPSAPVRITGVRVDGVNQPPASDLNLAPDIRQIEVQYSGIDYSLSRQTLYQFKLEGVDRDWSTPTPERRVNYANLAPGNYHFMVRVAGSEQPHAGMPASLGFNIAAPLSQRWWFRLLLVIVIAVAGYAVHRIRVQRAVAVERLRLQIAADLHDDIGSSLSQIAVLSEVARLRAAARDDMLAQPLSRIGEVACEVGDSMSDIVWSINPKHDRLADLVYRVRSFADETLNGSGIRFEMIADGSGAISLDARQRRDVFLVLKEGIHNALRHSGCSVVTVSIGIEHHRLSVRVTDNGTGFDVEAAGDGGGTGLQSIRRRAGRLKAGLAITSENGRGSSIHLLVPLAKRDYLNI
jgi:ligand-binding sensor domain-containing protein